MKEMLLRLKFSKELIDNLAFEPKLNEMLESIYRLNVSELRLCGFEDPFILDLMVCYPEAMGRMDLCVLLNEFAAELGEDWAHLVWEDYIRNGECRLFEAIDAGNTYDFSAILQTLQLDAEELYKANVELLRRYEFEDKFVFDLRFLYVEVFERTDLGELLEKTAEALGEGWQSAVWQDYLLSDQEKSCLFEAFERGTEEALAAAFKKLQQTFSSIYIAGDTHGHRQRLLDIIEKKNLMVDDLLIVLGDFSFIYRNDEREMAFLDRLEQEKNCTIAFIDGNHENFPAIYDYPVEEWCGGKIHRIRKNIVHLMRGQVFQFRDRKFFTMGGAYSMDRYIPGKLFWKEELPNAEEYHEATRNLERHNHKVDYILTHTAPAKMIMEMGENPDGHDMELTGFLEYVRREVEHYRWFCGHWHPNQYETDHFKVVYKDVVEL